MTQPIAVVTGASSGIGREAALALQARGATVFPVARRPMPDLARRGMTPLSLDLTDEAALTAGVDQILDQAGRIDILVNNAGYGSYGAIEDVDLAEARRQFEVNVFAAWRLTQLVLPPMIDAGHGRIVNVSSMGGQFAMALGGWYHATKYAIEALSDALRQEVRPLGVEVVIIEPGLVHTDWARVAADHLRQTSGLGRYAHLAHNFATGLEFATRFATDPAVIGQVIARAATTAHPRTRYRKGLGALPLTSLIALLPDRAFDCVVRLLLGQMGTLLELLDVSPPVPGRSAPSVG
jgi:NAD(P)-dependent dehydrogenase (short-subunit alcohol dehydrogenase family)